MFVITLRLSPLCCCRLPSVSREHRQSPLLPPGLHLSSLQHLLRGRLPAAATATAAEGSSRRCCLSRLRLARQRSNKKPLQRPRRGPSLQCTDTSGPHTTQCLPLAEQQAVAKETHRDRHSQRRQNRTDAKGLGLPKAIPTELPHEKVIAVCLCLCQFHLSLPICIWLRLLGVCLSVSVYVSLSVPLSASERLSPVPCLSAPSATRCTQHTLCLCMQYLCMHSLHVLSLHAECRSPLRLDARHRRPQLETE